MSSFLRVAFVIIFGEVIYELASNKDRKRETTGTGTGTDILILSVGSIA